MGLSKMINSCRSYKILQALLNVPYRLGEEIPQIRGLTTSRRFQKGESDLRYLHCEVARSEELLDQGELLPRSTACLSKILDPALRPFAFPWL